MSSGNSDGVTPCGGAKYRWGIKIDLERTLTLFSRSRHSLTLNISQTATDTAIVIEDEWETVPKLLNGTNFNDFE